MLRSVIQRIRGSLPTQHELALCAASAVLLIFSYPRAALAPCAWIAFIPLFLVIEHTSARRAFFLSYSAGVIFWAGTIYWLIHVTLLGQIVLVLYVSLYFGVFGMFIARFKLLSSRCLFYSVPAVWVVLEYLRSHLLTGFGWGLLGYSQSRVLPLIQIADITGAWGVSFLVMLINVVIFSLTGYRYLVIGNKREYRIVAACFLFVLCYGSYRMLTVARPTDKKPLMVSVIQPNIMQELKWDPAARPYILREYGRLTAAAAQRAPELIVWPEAASPAILGEDDDIFGRMVSMSKDAGIPVLLGVVRRENERYFNSAVMINPSFNAKLPFSSAIEQRYDKLHLVPFGEYIPLKKVFPFLEAIVPIGDISAGGE